MREKLYCVVYRTGGTRRCIWRRTVAMTRAEAVKAQAEVERQGYKALIEGWDASLAIGLPEGWDADYLPLDYAPTFEEYVFGR